MNLSNPFGNQEQPVESPKPVENVFRTAAIIFGAALVVVVFYLFLAWQLNAWQMYTLTGVIAVFSVTNALALSFIRRGRQETGIWMIIIGMLIIFPAAALLVSGVSVIFGGVMVLLTLIVANQTLPSKPARQAIIIAVVVGILIASLDLFQLNYRLYVPEIQTFVPAITGVTLLIVGIFIARQAWGGSLRNKLLVAFIGVTVFAMGALSAFVIYTTTNALRANLERELTALASSRATQLGDLLNQQINNLTTLSLGEVVQQAVTDQNQSYKGDAAAIQVAIDAKDAAWRAADAAKNDADPLVKVRLTNPAALDLIEYQKTFPDNAEVFITDIHGGLVATSNRTSDYNQADEAWWQAAYNKGLGATYISVPQLDESSGKIGIQFALPLRDRDSGRIIGILRTTYILTPLGAILQQEIGQTGEADLFAPGENLVQIQGNSLETPSQPLFEKVKAIAAQSMAEMDYEGDFSVVSQAAVRSLVNNPAIDNLGWVVAFHQHRDEAFALVNAQIQGIVIVIVLVLILAILAAIFIAQLLVGPLTQLTITAQEISAGNFSSQARVTTSDEFGLLALAFNNMTGRMRDFIATLEQRVAERTRGLELASEVGRSVSQVRALDVMLKDAVEIIRSQFDLYYAQVYLTNVSQTELVLQAGTGTVGAVLVGREHRLPLNTGSINGRAAIEKRSVIISDTAASATFRPNALLPDTRSEMAIPLLVGDKVVGVLDMQSRQAGALSQDSAAAFEALAGQLAVAIQNATLLAETEQARAEVENQARRLVRAGWNEFMDAIHRPEQTSFVFEKNQVLPLETVEQSQPLEGMSPLSASIAVSGEPLGELIVDMEEGKQTVQVVELVNIVASQVARQIENLRLLENAERYRAEAEESSRRLTREGWKDYVEVNAHENLSYIYDLKEVRANDSQASQPSEETGLRLPIKVRDEAIGKFVIQGLQGADVETVSFANAVADRLGAHIESLRQFDETKRGQMELDKRARQLAAVAEISSISSRELDINKMLTSVVHLTQRKFGLYHAHVFTFDEHTTAFHIAACGWKEGDEHEGTHGTTAIPLALERSLVARAGRTRQAVVVNDVRNESGWLPNPLLPDTVSEMAVPLIIGDQILGVLDVQSDRLNAFSDEDASIFATLASQVSTALQNARSFVSAQKQAERETTLNIISQKIQSATTVEAVLQIAARELGHALGSPRTIAQLSVKDRK